jgi:hypothetical protein
MRTVIALAIAAIALTAAGTVGVAEAGATPCVYLCNQYVRPYYKPSTGTWVQGYWRNSPSDLYRATPYPTYTYPSYYPSYGYGSSYGY